MAAIATPSGAAIAAAASAATAPIPIPIVFSVPVDPVKTGLVASFVRPGGNARSIGLRTKVLNATSGDIDAAFARLAHDRGDDLYANDVRYVSRDALFQSSSQQLVALTPRDRIPAAYPGHATVAAGRLMNYGSDVFEIYRHVYIGNILKGARPADLPVQRATKFEFVINRKTAEAPGPEIPVVLRVSADLID